uniref:Sodium/hydrogen exchanger 6-like n=1 Tax=Rhizophora mucronata TaxID=61149 RepID=A0A2P2M8K4_RHIMU
MLPGMQHGNSVTMTFRDLENKQIYECIGMHIIYPLSVRGKRNSTGQPEDIEPTKVSRNLTITIMKLCPEDA